MQFALDESLLNSLVAPDKLVTRIINILLNFTKPACFPAKFAEQHQPKPRQTGFIPCEQKSGGIEESDYSITFQFGSGYLSLKLCCSYIGEFCLTIATIWPTSTIRESSPKSTTNPGITSKTGCLTPPSVGKVSFELFIPRHKNETESPVGLLPSLNYPEFP